MSVKLSTAVWQFSESRLAARLVMLAIADFCDDAGTAYPAIKTVAKKAGLSERKVQQAVKELCDMKELSVEANAGPHGCNVYRIHLSAPPVQTLHPENSTGCKVEQKGVQTFREGVQNTTKRGENFAPKPSLDPSGSVIDPSPPARADWFPETLRTDAFRRKWGEWEDHLRESSKPITGGTRRAQLSECERAGELRSIEVINLSLTQGWKSLVWDHQPKHGSNSQNPRHTGTLNSGTAYPKQTVLGGRKPRKDDGVVQ